MASDEQKRPQDRAQDGVRMDKSPSSQMLRWLDVLPWLFWPTFFLVQATANVATVAIEMRRYGLPFRDWELATWEFSSNLVWLALVPAILALWRRWPPTGVKWARHLVRHGGCSLAASILHVMLMVGIRKLVYALHDAQYDFGSWWVELPYEAMKDVRTYALIILFAEMWRLVLWRLQGEASLPDSDPAASVGHPREAHSIDGGLNPEGGPGPTSELATVAPEHFLVKKLGREYLLPVAEIEWIQSSGNYVLLRFRGQDYPQRTTLAAIEERLGRRFARVHRSYLINLAVVRQIEPTSAGDAKITTVSGGLVPCSRTHLEALRLRLL